MKMKLHGMILLAIKILYETYTQMCFLSVSSVSLVLNQETSYSLQMESVSYRNENAQKIDYDTRDREMARVESHNEGGGRVFN